MIQTVEYLIEKAEKDRTERFIKEIVKVQRKKEEGGRFVPVSLHGYPKTYVLVRKGESEKDAEKRMNAKAASVNWRAER